ncbi:hypothetical protein ABIF69_005534 [Bradyrhizobium japonicum]
MAQITINGITIDPSAPHAERAALSLDHANAKESDYIIVQTNQPLNAERREQLAKAGAEILEAVPGSAVICHFPAAGLDKVRKLPFVPAGHFKFLRVWSVKFLHPRGRTRDC